MGRRRASRGRGGGKEEREGGKEVRSYRPHQLRISCHDHGGPGCRDEERRLPGCCLSGAQHLRLMTDHAQ